MLAWLRKWYTARKESQDQIDYRNGYDWATGCLLRVECTLRTVLTNYQVFNNHGDTAYAQGILDGVNRLRAIGYVTDDFDDLLPFTEERNVMGHLVKKPKPPVPFSPDQKHET